MVASILFQKQRHIQIIERRAQIQKSMKFDDFNGILKKVAEPHENLQKTDSGPEVFDDNFFTVQKHGKTHRTKKNHPTLAKTIFQNVCKKRRTLARSRFQPPKFQPHLFILLLSLEKAKGSRSKVANGKKNGGSKECGLFHAILLFCDFLLLSESDRAYFCSNSTVQNCSFCFIL